MEQVERGRPKFLNLRERIFRYAMEQVERGRPKFLELKKFLCNQSTSTESEEGKQQRTYLDCSYPE